LSDNDEHLQESGLLRAVPALHVRGWKKAQSVQESRELRQSATVQTEKVHTVAGKHLAFCSLLH